MWGFLFAGLALFAVAAKLHFWLGRRQFERRNSAGIEGFEDYSSMVKIRIKEGFVFAGGMVIGLSGVACIFIFLLALTKLSNGKEDMEKATRKGGLSYYGFSLSA